MPSKQQNDVFFSLPFAAGVLVGAFLVARRVTLLFLLFSLQHLCWFW